MNAAGRSEQSWAGRPAAEVFAIELTGLCRGLGKALFDPYRPERHYMRGPGPRWHARHGQPSGALARPARLDRGAVP